MRIAVLLVASILTVGCRTTPDARTPSKDGVDQEAIDAGHFVYFEEPEAFSAAVMDFVGSNDR